MNKKLIIVLLVFAVIGVGLFFVLTTGNIGAKYNTTQVVETEIGKYVGDVGTVSSRNIRKYYGNGLNKVESFSLEIGDSVTKGQLLIKYENNIDLEIQKVKKQIEGVEATYKDLLSGTDVETISSARIEISRVSSLLDNAKKNKERVQVLYDNGAATLVELERADEEIKNYQNSLNVARNNYNQVSKEISEHVREKYEADIDVLLISLEILESSKDKYAVYADVDGIVTQVHTFVGDIPMPGMAILEIQDPTEKVINVDFMVEDALLIKEALPAEVNDLDMNIVIENLKVDKVYPTAFITLSELAVEENRQRVEIGLKDQANDLPFGLELNTRVMIEEKRQALVVPKGALIYKDSKVYVGVLEEGEVVEKVITTGIMINGDVEVVSGLLVGEEVILNYQEETEE
ncbi:efflux RND transporter periplasmic adaptor subunit [Acidaminobacter sp. JC074]|uniref:efflux RND transporter periplasmic adaptor subunit n=1 Tax=Acidaminobacter sp. JC074 TaxID=2530199 RepID=UPI001F0D116E|nr:efflux RND transporter periplasmic adaptor subunit [Acidaminobacter sp. JC074]MCH4891007.1 efflux RND transporter periplasmic adaptor subunit [Acidaminobacter sp. JC074]